MKTPEEIAQWVINNRYPQNEKQKVSDAEMYHTLVESIANLCNLPVVSINEADSDCDYDVNIKPPFKTKRYKMKVISEVTVCNMCGNQLENDNNGKMVCKTDGCFLQTDC